ncbi:MAG: hypothetical protein ACP5E3_19010 [Bacteroidales bacterium]
MTGRILSIAYGPNYLFYLATEENILLKDPYTPGSTLEMVFPAEMDLPFQQIARIRFDPQGRLWIASDAGLFWYQSGSVVYALDPATEKFSLILQNKGVHPVSDIRISICIRKIKRMNLCGGSKSKLIIRKPGLIFESCYRYDANVY